MEQASRETVELVWNELVGADRLHRYYGYLTLHLEKTSAWLLLMAVVCSGGAFFAIVSGLEHPWDKSVAVLTLAAAGLNVWLATKNYARMVAHSSDMHRQLSRLLLEWEELWADVYVSDDETVRSRWRELQRRTSAVTAQAASQVPLVESLAEKSQQEAYSYRALRYAPS